MKQSLPTTLGIIFKKVTGIQDISLFRKNVHKRIGKLLYHQKYTADDIVATMCTLGMKRGSTVCIHSSMKEFYNYQGTAEELIQKIQKVITAEGTLLMPAYPNPRYQKDPNYIFNPKTDPTLAGHLAEVFRKRPDVVRSINIQHSVCAWGKYAKWLTEEHAMCTNCWDEKSPWYKMTTQEALVFTLGLNKHYIGTFDHCVEAILYKEYEYWRQFFTVQKTYRYYDTDGTIKDYTCIEGNLERRTHEQRLIRYFTSRMYNKKKISNLLIKVFHSKPCLERMIELGRKGITMYYVPSTKGYQFDTNR